MLHNNENVNMYNEKNVNPFTIKFIVQGHFPKSSTDPHVFQKLEI